MKIFTIILLSVTIMLGDQFNSQLKIQRMTKLIDSRDGTFRIDFNLDSLHSMITKKVDTNLQKIKIDIAQDKTVTVLQESIEVNKENNSTYSWFGKTLDGKGEVVFSVRKGRMIGTITIGSDRYSVIPDGKYFKVIKNDLMMMVPFEEDTVPSPFKFETLDSETEGTAELKSPGRSSGKAVVAGEISIDVMILYTKEMKNKYGDDTELIIQHLFDLAQKAYIDSQTNVKLNLIHLQQLPESSTLNGIQPDGNHLNAVASDGYVGYLRRTYKADMVSIISRYNGGSGCGIGLLPIHQSDPMTSAFSIVMVRSASEGSGSYCSDMTLAHELGHNFSCNHDRDHTSGASMYEYSYGYDISGEFATIMSYDSPEISYFSNPDIEDVNSGDPIGVADEEDNARAIRNTSIKIADNSDEIDESTESGDRSLADGRLNSNLDRDAYFITLGGQTVFQVAYPKYSNTWGYYINIYNTKTHAYVTSCKNDCEISLENGRYRVVVSYHNDDTGSYYDGNGDDYAVDVTTEYSLPPLPVSIINYILD